MNAVEIKNLSFSYDGKTEILKNLDLSLEYGKLYLLAGLSGEGKSTLIKIISGIIPNVYSGVLHGEIFVEGANIDGQKLGQVCKKVGVVLQNADEQIVHKIVEDEIAFGVENLGVAPSQIAKKIDIVCNLLQLDKNEKTRTLSGGQKQRLITASTLAMGQKILILDEPLANLDKEGTSILMQTLKALVENGYCVVIVEHRLDMIIDFADVVLNIANKQVDTVLDKQEFLKLQTTKILDTCLKNANQGLAFCLKNIDFSIGKKQILKNICCEIEKGKRTVLLGENGVGKTTLMRILAKLNKPTQGVFCQFIDSSFSKHTNKKWFKKVGVVYQNPDYQLFMPTVRQEIEFGAKDKKYAEEMAQLFDVKKLWDKHPQSLSQGQKRRVSICAVVASQPEVLLLDEPTVGQDYNGLCKLVKILNDLHDKTGNTMITITHDARCAEALCDNAILIASGKINKCGDKKLVKKYFANEFC